MVDVPLLRTVEFGAAFDRRHPDPAKNYGIHGVDLRMVLSGPEGAVQFVLYTAWHLPHVAREQHGRTQAGDVSDVALRCRYDPLPADLGYHSPVPHYEGQTVIDEACRWLGGRPCYYDGSGLNAERIYGRLLEGGSDAVWAELETYYREVFAPAEVAP